jgi:hypothetical protein
MGEPHEGAFGPLGQARQDPYVVQAGLVAGVLGDEGEGVPLRRTKRRRGVAPGIRTLVERGA